MDILGVSPNTWFPVVTLIAGGVLKGIFDWLADSRTAKRERDARFDERREIRRLRRIEFQRETLLELQDVISVFARHTTQAHLRDVKSFEETGMWGKALFPDELSEADRLNRVRLLQLRVRVRNPDIRQYSKDAVSIGTSVYMASDKSDSMNRLTEMSNRISVLHDAIGEELRSLDDIEDREI